MTEEEQARKIHDDAHDICNDIMLVMLAHRAKNAGLTINAVVYGFEMAASLARRIAKERGAPREQVKVLRACASSCARGMFASAMARNDYESMLNPTAVTPEQEAAAAKITEAVFEKIQKDDHHEH